MICDYSAAGASSSALLAASAAASSVSAAVAASSSPPPQAVVSISEPAVKATTMVWVMIFFILITPSGIINMQNKAVYQGKMGNLPKTAKDSPFLNVEYY
jgi:hypothetical protein